MLLRGLVLQPDLTDAASCLLSKAADDRLVGELKGKGVQIEAVDRRAFVDATRPVYDKWAASPAGDFFKRGVQQAN